MGFQYNKDIRKDKNKSKKGERVKCPLCRKKFELNEYNFDNIDGIKMCYCECGHEFKI